jgi:hypothetical protein
VSEENSAEEESISSSREITPDATASFDLGGSNKTSTASSGDTSSRIILFSADKAKSEISNLNSSTNEDLSAPAAGSVDGHNSDVNDSQSEAAVTPVLRPVSGFELDCPAPEPVDGTVSGQAAERKELGLPEVIQPLGPKPASPVSLNKVPEVSERDRPAVELVGNSSSTPAAAPRRGVVLWQAKQPSRQTSDEPSGPDCPAPNTLEKRPSLVPQTHSAASTTSTTAFVAQYSDGRALSRSGSAEPWVLLQRSDCGINFLGVGGYSAGPMWTPTEAMPLQTPTWSQISTGPSIYGGGWML